MVDLELNIIHELVRRQIPGDLNPIIESIYEKAIKDNLDAETATVAWIREKMKVEKTEGNKIKETSNRPSRYEAIYLPFKAGGKNDPENDASQLKNFTAPDDWTAMVYGIALVSADRENYFKDDTHITKAAARNYVYDFLYPESFPLGKKKNHISFTDLYDMLQETQNDDHGKGTYEPYTDYGYLFSLTKQDDNSVLYKGDLDPHDWNYEFPFWWHNGKHSDKYTAYIGDDEALEDHLPKRRF